MTNFETATGADLRIISARSALDDKTRHGSTEARSHGQENKFSNMFVDMQIADKGYANTRSGVCPCLEFLMITQASD